MKLPAAEAVATGYDQTPESLSAAYAHSLWSSIEPRQLIPALAEALPLMRRAWGRAQVLSSLVPYARLSREAVDLAILALADRSYLVRQEACAVLAYSLDPSALKPLEAAAASADPRTLQDAQAAISAIRGRDHNLYADRAGNGNTFWQVPHVAGL
jgi:hypothetical protein